MSERKRLLAEITEALGPTSEQPMDKRARLLAEIEEALSPQPLAEKLSGFLRVLPPTDGPPQNTAGLRQMQDAARANQERLGFAGRALSRGAADIPALIGAPVDIANSVFGTNFIGGQDIKRGLLDLSEIVARTFRGQTPQEQALDPEFGTMFSRRPEDDASTASSFLTNTLENIGAAGAAAGPVRAITGQLAAPIVPRAAATEIAASTGAGAARTASDEAGVESPTARMLLELAGGVLGGAVPNVGVRVRTSRLFKPGQKNRVASAVQTQASNPEVAARNIQSDLEADLPGTPTAAGAANDVGLGQLERQLSSSQSAIGAQRVEARERSLEAIRTSVDSAELNLGGSPAATQARMEQWLDETTGKLDAGIARVIRESDEALSATGARTFDDPQQASRAVSGKLLELEDAARDAERAIWSRVQSNETIPPTKTAEFVEENLGSLRYNKIDADVRGVLENELSDTVRVSRLQEVRSIVLDDMRQARREGRRGAKNLLNRLQSALLDDLMDARGSEALRTAQRYSKHVTDRFVNGPLGKVLAQDGTGDTRLPADRTLDELLSPSQGGRGADALDMGEPALVDASKDYLRLKFNEAKDKAGFMSRNRSAIQRLGLEDDFKAAHAAKERVELTGKQNTAAAKRLRSKAAATAIIGMDPNKAIPSLLARKTRMRDTRVILRRAADDPEAVEGLQRGLLDEMSRRGAFDTAAGFKRFMKSNGEIVATILRDKPEVLARVKKAGRALERDARANRRVNVGGSDTTELMAGRRQLATGVGRILGARIGARLGAGAAGSQLQTAGFLSGRLGQILRDAGVESMERMMTEALFDPALMRRLLLKETPKAQRALQLHLLNNFTEDEE